MSIDPVVTDANTGGSFNRYAYAANNPYKYIDPDGRAIETVWDAANVAMGAASLAKNVSAGNYAMAVVDAIGVGVDVVATATPFVPGGAASAIKVSRGVDAAVSGSKVGGRNANKLAPVGGADGAHSVIKRDANGNVTNTATYTPNSKNPSGFDEVKRVDVTGKSHTNPDGTNVPTPHVHESGQKGVRPAVPEDLPKQ